MIDASQVINIALGIFGGLLLFTLAITAFVGACDYMSKLRHTRHVTGRSYVDQLRDRAKVRLMRCRRT